MAQFSPLSPPRLSCVRVAFMRLAGFAAACTMASLAMAAEAAPDDLPVCGSGAPGASPVLSDGSAEDAPPADLDPQVWTRLGEIEQGGADVRSMTARILMREDNDLTMASTTRTGRLVYRMSISAAADGSAPAKPRALAVLFDARIDGNRRRPQALHYVFSGRWLAEIDVDQRLFTRYEIAVAGEDFDPMRLGQGPVPLPVGQPRDEVLRRFTVRMATLPADGPLARLAEGEAHYVLHLTPREGSSEAEEMRSLLLVYSAQSHLPLGVRVETAEGDLRTARLDDLAINPVLTEADLAGLSVEPPADREGWRIESRGAAAQ